MTLIRPTADTVGFNPMTQQTKLRNFLINATYLKISEVARLTGIPRETLSKFINSTYETKNGVEPHGLNEKYVEPLENWLHEFTNFKI